MVLAAVAQNGDALEYATAAMKEEVVLAAAARELNPLTLPLQNTLSQNGYYVLSTSIISNPKTC